MADCIYDANDKKCLALTAKRCTGCRFKLTQEEKDAKAAKTQERLRSLPMSLQYRIADTYYGGVMEWQE